MTPGQDAAQRAEVCIGQGIKEGLQGIEVPWQLREHIRKVIDTAVAEAVKERDAEIARLRRAGRGIQGEVICQLCHDADEARREEWAAKLDAVDEILSKWEEAYPEDVFRPF